jgi:hypothetical protein
LPVAGDRGGHTIQLPMTPDPQAQLLRHAPYFPVANVEQSSAHYENVLGFRCDYIAGQPAEFAILTRDGLAIMLRRVSEPDRIRPNEQQGGTWDVFFWIRNADQLHAELAANGADVVYGPIVQDAYQMREFAVRDGDGYVLGFGEPVENAGR